jgi:hypothetical protein
MSTTNLETQWGPTIAYSRLLALVEALDELLRVVSELLASGKAPTSEQLAGAIAAREAVNKAREAHQETKAWALSTATSQKTAAEQEERDQRILERLAEFSKMGSPFSGGSLLWELQASIGALHEEGLLSRSGDIHCLRKCIASKEVEA